MVGAAFAEAVHSGYASVAPIYRFWSVLSAQRELYVDYNGSDIILSLEALRGQRLKVDIERTVEPRGIAKMVFDRKRQLFCVEVAS